MLIVVRIRIFELLYFSFNKPISVKQFLYIVFIIAFASFLFLARGAKYKEFHETNINGQIDTVYRYRDYVMLFVNKEEFRIIPISISRYDRFDDIAKIGDSVFKKANNDTLSLIHKNNRYLYTVQKW